MKFLTAHFATLETGTISYDEALKIWIDDNKCYPKHEQSEIKAMFVDALNTAGEFTHSGFATYILN